MNAGCMHGLGGYTLETEAQRPWGQNENLAAVLIGEGWSCEDSDSGETVLFGSPECVVAKGQFPRDADTQPRVASQCC